jgi:zinc finger CCCH domain-containing protein 13
MFFSICHISLCGGQNIVVCDKISKERRETEKQRNRETEKQRNRETEKQRNRETEKQRNRNRETEKQIRKKER